MEPKNQKWHLSLLLSATALATGCSSKAAQEHNPEVQPMDAAKAMEPSEFAAPAKVAAPAKAAAPAKMLTSDKWMSKLPEDVQQLLFSLAYCPTTSCGNSAKLGVEELGALATDGERDPLTAFRLVVGSLVGGKGQCESRSSLSVGVEDGELVGFDPATKTLLCRGAELKGATFKVTDGEKTFEIVVRDRSGVESWERRPRTLPAYDFATSVVDESGITRVQDLCREGSSAAGSLSSVAVVKHGGAWGGGATYALLVQGERYDHAARVSARDPKWFNIACAGTGIAKLRLMGFDPLYDGQAGPVPPGRVASSVAQRQATLKMLTGRFCGDFPHTWEGVSINFSREGDGDIAGSPRIGPIEALWDANGATCLSHWRGATPASGFNAESELAVVGMIREACGLKPCSGEAVSCTTPFRGKGVWRTCTVDHVVHSQP